MKSIELEDKLGIFPGSFDPFHAAHMKIMELSFSQVGVTKIILIPLRNARKAQTPLAERYKALTDRFRNDPRIIVIHHEEDDYLSLIDTIVRSNSHSLIYRLMGETCYNAYPEVGIPPLRDEPDRLTNILQSQNVIVLPNPFDNHPLNPANLPNALMNKVIRLIVPKGEEQIYLTSISQKIKHYPFLGLKELKYDQYYTKSLQGGALDLRSWEKEFWSRENLRVGLSHGTFNSVHDGHRSLWHEALRQLSLDAVFVWPSLYPAHKPSSHSFLDRVALLSRALANEPHVHLLSTVEQFFSGVDQQSDVIEQILNGHEEVVDWIMQNLPQTTTYYRLFGSDSINTYLQTDSETPSLASPFQVMLSKGRIAVLGRAGHALPISLPDGVIELKIPPGSEYFTGLSTSSVEEIYNRYGRIQVQSVQSKHLPQNLTDERAKHFDRLAEKVGYAYPRVGLHKGMPHAEDIRKVHDLAVVASPRPVKFVITRDNRIWADNTHWALASLLRYGPEVIVQDIAHYFVDLRNSPPTIVNRPDTLVTQRLEVAIENAMEIQDRLDRGWRPPQLSFTIGEVFDLGGY